MIDAGRIDSNYELLDHVPLCLMVIDRNYTVIYINHSMEEQCGLQRSQLLGTDLRDCFPDFGKPMYASRMSPVFTDGAPVVFSSDLHKHLFNSRLPNGQLRIQRTTVTALPAPEGEGYYALLAIEDLTEVTRRSQAYVDIRDKALAEVAVRRRVEDELKESMKMTRALLDVRQDVACLVKPDGTIIYTNAQAAKLVERAPEDCDGKNMFELLPENLVEPRKAQVERAIANLEVVREVDEHNGTTLEFSAYPVLDDDENVVHLALYARDITDQLESEKALRDSEKRFRLATENSADVVWTMTKSDSVDYVSPSVKDLLGYTPDEFVRLTLADFMSPETLAIAKQRQKKRQQAHSQNLDFSYSIEATFVRRNGNTIPLELRSSTMRDDDGKIVGAMGTLQDITERKNSEKKLQASERRLAQANRMLRLVLDTIPVRVFWKDKNLHYLGCNYKFAKDAGYEDTNDIVGKSDYEMSWSANAEQYRAINRQVVIEQKPLLDFEVPMERAGAEPMVVKASLVPLKASDGEVLGMLGTYEDVTEQRKVQEQKRDLLKKLNKAQKMEALGILAGGVAHDLNNMLGPLVGYPELLLRKLPPDSPMCNQVKRIGKAAQDAADVIQDLLTLARRGRYEMTPVDLKVVVLSYLDSPSYQRLVEDRPEVQVEIDLDEDTGIIKGSAVHLAKVVMNLVVNAFDAMPAGGSLSVSMCQKHLDASSKNIGEVRDGDYVALRVRDTGSGIAPENIDKIFEPYFSRKRMGTSGSGLGLSVVYGIVKDHGGSYEIESELGKGTEFCLYFPLTTEAITAQVGTQPSTGGTESVLIVDDVVEQREIAREFLDSLGYEVAMVADGHEAIEYLKDHKVDILVMDMIMEPGFDGLDTYRVIKKMCPHQKAVIVSGFSPTERVEEMQRLGAGEYIKKPYTLVNLDRAIRAELTAKQESAPTPAEQ